MQRPTPAVVRRQQAGTPTRKRHYCTRTTARRGHTIACPTMPCEAKVCACACPLCNRPCSGVRRRRRSGGLLTQDVHGCSMVCARVVLTCLPTDARVCRSLQQRRMGRGTSCKNQTCCVHLSHDQDLTLLLHGAIILEMADVHSQFQCILVLFT